MYSLDDTIAAISTPIGEGGIGMVRMTGPGAAQILSRLFLPGAVTVAPSPGSEARQKRAPGPASELLPYRLNYGHIVEPDSLQTVDEVLAVHMPAPRTYTRQDVVEINGHGGIVALQRILELCLRSGARLAEPGEFTARAFLNGRLDLAQAEAVLDIVQARTEKSLQAAVGQLAGHLSLRMRVVRDRLVGVLAYLEASIDFEEDEIPVRDIGPDLDEAMLELSRLMQEAEQGIIYRQGVRAAIVGRPNVGKSSLLNRLLRTSRAIVTEIPGTTRDTLEETLNLRGVPVVLVDTAGITPSTEDLIERLGVDRSREALSQADLALLVLDASQPLAEADRAIAALIGDKPAIVVLNKMDLIDAAPGAHRAILDGTSIPISALTGEGMCVLEDAMVDAVFEGKVTTSSTPVVTNPRHKQAIGQAQDHVASARAGYCSGLPADLLAIDVSAAINVLGAITGQTASDDLLETIFGNFCIGK
ncbi:tRNA uridine-5-carboxymethylaminomethyl(34) synthesis GTPase MnmE [Chloroflexota bacterium]